MWEVKADLVRPSVDRRLKPMIERRYLDEMLDKADGSVSRLKTAWDDARDRKSPAADFVKWDSDCARKAVGGVMMPSEQKAACFVLRWGWVE